MFSDELAAGVEHCLAEYNGASVDVAVDIGLTRIDLSDEMEKSRRQAFGDSPDDSKE